MPDRPLRWILDGRTPVPCHDTLAWGEWMATTDRQVGRSEIRIPGAEPMLVSTVFLGVDHGALRPHPVVFETMVLGGPFDRRQWRYSSWTEAEAGHAAVVAELTQRQA